MHRCAKASCCTRASTFPLLNHPLVSMRVSSSTSKRVCHDLPHTYRQRYRCASESKPTLCSIRRNRRLLLIIECWGNEKKERKKEEKAGMHESRRRDFPCSSNARSFECCFVVRDIRVERRSRTIVGERGYLELILI